MSAEDELWADLLSQLAATEKMTLADAHERAEQQIKAVLELTDAYIKDERPDLNLSDAEMAGLATLMTYVIVGKNDSLFAALAKAEQFIDAMKVVDMAVWVGYRKGQAKAFERLFGEDEGDQSKT